MTTTNPNASTAPVATAPTVQALSTPSDKKIKRGFLYNFNDWGTPYWQFMHAITFLYPDVPTADDRQRIINIFSSLPFVLPCSLCGLHLAQNITAMPLTETVLSSKTTLSTWLVNLHNVVNRKLKKPEVTYEDARYFYTVDSSHSLRPMPDDLVNRWQTCSIILAILLIGLIVGIAFMAINIIRQKNRCC